MSYNKSLTAVTFAGIFLLVSAGARSKDAELECPGTEPPVNRGLTIKATLGGAFWSGKVGERSLPGPAFSFGVGYEIFSFLAAEVAWASGINRAHQASPPNSGEFASHALHGGLRFTLPLDRFDLFIRGGVGFLLVAPNILIGVPEFDGRPKFSWQGGCGFTWHTPRKHFWIGLESGVIGASDIPGIQILAFGVIGTTL